MMCSLSCAKPANHREDKPQIRSAASLPPTQQFFSRLFVCQMQHAPGSLLSSKILGKKFWKAWALWLLRSTPLFFSIVNENRPAKQVRAVTVHEPTFNEQ